MRYVLENSELRIEIESLGAELRSIRKGEREYMWCGDAEYWNYTSPILFPFVGSLNGQEFRYQGKRYSMSQHGFARDYDFSLVEESEKMVLLELRSNDEMLERYPFPFVLRVGYELSDNRLKISYWVNNPSSETLHFSIGAHPAFNCPINGEDSKVGYRLYFEDLDELRYFGNHKESRLVVKDEHVLKLEDHRAIIDAEFFKKYTYIVEGSKSDLVGIEDKEGRRYLNVYFDTPLFAIWSPAKKDAPFVCIEPWFGRGDPVGFDGELEEREYNNSLEKNEVFATSFVVELL